MTPQLNPLTREQKLLGEIVVQLGNIAERISHIGTDDGQSLQDKIDELQAELTTTSQERAELSTALAVANSKVAALQTAITSFNTGDITPDSMVEVMSHLNIPYAQ